MNRSEIKYCSARELCIICCLFLAQKMKASPDLTFAEMDFSDAFGISVSFTES